MFTGIVAGLGECVAFARAGTGARLAVRSPVSLASQNLGDSIAINGACLTVVSLNRDCFEADLSAETLACTTLGTLKPGIPVNLELALRLGDALGGHLVTGHVDGVGGVIEATPQGAMLGLTLRCPPDLARYIATKGSITVDGVSLTVNLVAWDTFTVQIIPHTLEKTLIGSYRPGTAVNLEVDLLARYVERMSLAAPASKDDPAREERLQSLLRGLARPIGA
jgi:riboflavin synthase